MEQSNEQRLASTRWKLVNCEPDGVLVSDAMQEFPRDEHSMGLVITLKAAIRRYLAAAPAAQPQAPSEAVALHAMIVELARATYHALDDSEELPNGYLLDKASIEKIGAALDALEESLPATPGYVSSAVSNLRYALRHTPGKSVDPNESAAWRKIGEDACARYVHWYSHGQSAHSGNMAYELVSAIRQMLAAAPSAGTPEEPRHAD